MSTFRRYLNIDRRTLNIVDKIISKGYFKKKFKERFEILKDLNKKLSVIYKIKICKIKVVPYWIVNKSKSNEFIIGDQLSLVSFLAKFKNNLDFQRKNTDREEVKMIRDNFDWALSVVESSNPEIVKRIFKAKEKFIKDEGERKEMEEEQEKELEEELNHAIESKGGK